MKDSQGSGSSSSVPQKRIRVVNKVTLMSIGVLLCGAGLSLASRAYDQPDAKAAEQMPGYRSGLSPAVIRAQAAATTEVEQIRITHMGFEPAEITRGPGPFLLAIDSTIGEVNLRLDRVGGARVRQVRMERNKRRLREIHELPPGDYIVTEEAHPTWSCKLTVTVR